MEVGLVGIISSDPQALAHINRMAQGLVALERATIAQQDTRAASFRMRIAPWIEPPIATDPVSGTTLMLLGHAWSGTQRTHAQTLLRNFLHGGETALTGLGGSFAVIIVRKPGDEISIITDRLGTKKIYCWNSPDTILLATELKALTEHPRVPRELDDGALEQFLITSHLVGRSSLVRNVNVLPPGSITRLDTGRIRHEFYWTPRIVAESLADLDAWADRLAGVLAPAIAARCGTDPFLLPLTGGLDSRTVAAFIPPRSIGAASAATFGHRHCYDVRYGRGMADALGIPFQYLPVPPAFFRQYLGPVQDLCDGEVSIEALPVYRLLDIGSPGQILLTGFLGDVLSGGHALGIEPSRSFSDAADVVWQRLYQRTGCSEQLLKTVFTPERFAAGTGSTRALMRQTINSAQAESLEEKVLIADLQHRQTRYITYLGRLLSSRYCVESPFLDVDVLDTFLALPLRHRLGQAAYRRMLARHAPRLAAIPEAKTRRPVTHAEQHLKQRRTADETRVSHLPAGLQWRLDKIRRGLGQLTVKLSGGWLGPHNRDYYVHHDENIRRVDPSWYRSVLNQDKLVEGFFRKDALNQLLDEHLARKSNHATRINNIVAFLHWRQRANIL